MKDTLKWLMGAACLLVIPALFIHLGLQVYIDDEALRSLVALEMTYSGNYITPTVHGDYYFNKPPLYNWWLLLFFKLFGHATEWVSRFPTILALLGFAIHVYWVFYREFQDRYLAFMQAFMLITCGRILFWDSMLGLIDMTFSWVIFSMFYVIYYRFKQEKWLSLFIIAYFLAAIGFLLKGLPAIVFIGGSLFGWFLYKKSFRKLFSLAHLAGVGVFLLLVGGYYFVYYLDNPDLNTVFSTLVSETTKRTVINQGVLYTIQHLFTFPFEMTYHFLPWSLFIVYFLHKGSWKAIQSNEFMTFCVVVFLVNILPYWTTPRTHPRYLLMFLPLVFGPFLYLEKLHRSSDFRIYPFLTILFGTLISLLVVASLLPFFLDRVHDIPFWQVKTVLLFLSFSGLTWWYWKQKAYRWGILVLALLVLRIGFNWFVLPERYEENPALQEKVDALRIAEKVKGVPLFLKEGTYYEHTGSFYLTQKRGAIIPKSTLEAEPDAFFLISSDDYHVGGFEKLDSMYLRHTIGQLYVVRPKEQ